MNLSGGLKRAISSSGILIISTLLFAQQPKPGLLWRISGNGLERPSYLFGTIHLTDKRVFNFGDSLYSALETSAGYAMELNPDSLMVHYFKDEIDKKPSPFIKDVVSPAKFSAAELLSPDGPLASAAWMVAETRIAAGRHWSQAWSSRFDLLQHVLRCG